MTRTRPPQRRHSWTQTARRDGQVFHITFGEMADGALAEVFITVAKDGTFVRDIYDALARTISVALQCGTPLEEIAKALGGTGVDWLAKVIRETYLTTTEES